MQPRTKRRQSGNISELTGACPPWSLLLAASSLASLPIVLLLLWLMLWGLVYRLPHAAPEVVDLRSRRSDRPCYLIFCSALADNLHGFPGHAFVVFCRSLPANLETACSIGFAPRQFYDQLPALWRPVPGTLGAHAARRNLRNLDALVAVVDERTYERARAIASSWRADRFQVGLRDCVAFSRALATGVGLRAPAPGLLFPQDYIVRLKQLNRHRPSGCKIVYQSGVFSLAEAGDSGSVAGILGDSLPAVADSRRP